MGKVTVTLTVSNLGDQLKVSAGEMSPAHIRSVTLNGVIVDTGSTLLCLPADVIAQLGLSLLYETESKQAVGYIPTKVYEGVRLTIAGRTGSFDCVELPAGEEALLGVVPMEVLGLEPDLQHQRLRVLPANSEQTYLSI